MNSDPNFVTEEKKVEKLDSEFFFDNMSDEAFNGFFSARGSEVLESHREGGESEISHVELKDKVDLRSLGRVATLQGEAYNLFIAGISSDFLTCTYKAMEAYESYMSKPLGIKEAKALIDQIKVIEESNISTEEAKILMQEANCVSEEVFVILESFLSHNKAKVCIINLESGNISFTDDGVVKLFFQEENLEEGKYSRVNEHVGPWVDMVHNKFKRLAPDANLRQVYAASTNAFTAFLHASDKESLLNLGYEFAAAITPKDTVSLSSTTPFTTKVISQHINRSCELVSPQIVAMLGPHLIKDSPLIQVSFDSTSPCPIVEVDDVKSVYVSSSSGVGGITYPPPLFDSVEYPFDPKIDDSEEEALRFQYVKPLDQMTRFYARLKEKGLVCAAGHVVLQTHWSSSLSAKQIVSCNVVGYVTPSFFRTLFARHAKGQLYESLSFTEVFNSWSFTLIDGKSGMFLAVPMAFLHDESCLRGTTREWGLPVSPSLLRVLPIYSSAFTLGIMESDDWNSLSAESFMDVRGRFTRSKELLRSDKYLEFVIAMVNVSNRIHPAAWIFSGSKKDVHPVVSAYAVKQGWEIRGSENTVVSPDLFEEFAFDT